MTAWSVPTCAIYSGRGLECKKWSVETFHRHSIPFVSLALRRAPDPRERRETRERPSRRMAMWAGPPITCLLRKYASQPSFGTLTHAHAYSHDIDSSRRSSRSPEATRTAAAGGPAAHNPAPRPCTRIAQWCSSPSHCVDPVMLLLIAPATCKCTRAAGRKPIRSTRARARNSTHVW